MVLHKFRMIGGITTVTALYWARTFLDPDFQGLNGHRWVVRTKPQSETVRELL